MQSYRGIGPDCLAEIGIIHDRKGYGVGKVGKSIACSRFVFHYYRHTVHGFHCMSINGIRIQKPEGHRLFRLFCMLTYRHSFQNQKRIATNQ